MLFEFLPILLFFAAFKLKGIFVATAVAITVGLIQLIYVYLTKRKIEPMLLISVAVLAVFGGFTLVLHNELFIKWKPTILYWIFSATLGLSQLIFKKNLIRALLDKQIQLSEKIWLRLNISWAGFFFLMGLLNLYVMARFSTNTWVNFKLFGLMGCMIIFVIAQSIFLSPHIQERKE